MNAKDLLAGNIARMRSRRGWTQAQLAAKAGVGQTTVSAIEKGKHSTSIDHLAALAAALGVPVWALLLDDGARDLLQQSDDLAHLMRTYAALTDDGRQEILRVAEREARYGNAAC